MSQPTPHPTHPHTPHSHSPGAPRRPLREHELTLRVRYHECDAMGVAHHANYAPWLEMGRTELLRTSGVSYSQLEREGVFLVVARMSISYRRPIRYDDIVRVRTVVDRASRIKIEHAYELWVVERAAPMGSIRPEGASPNTSAHVAPELCATAATTLACVDARGAVRPLPEWLVTE